MKNKTLLIFAILYCQSLSGIYAQQQTYFPTANVAWKNLKTDYGAFGDGIHDDTQAFRTAVRTYLNPFNSTVAVFIPKGTYLVSDSIQSLSNFFDCCLVVQGENRDSTIIKIKDNAPNFQNASSPRPVFKTRGGNQAFGNYFYNLTINTGLNNPAAMGFDYVTSNYGAIKNVNIISPDASGYCGISMEQTWPGPGIIKNVNINGFGYGIRVATCEYSMTFEDITLTNQRINGLYNDCNTLSIRHLRSNNSVTAIRNLGRIVLIDSELKGGILSNSAINSTSFLYVRNVQTVGYGTAIINNTQTVSTPYVSEFRSTGNYSQFPNDDKSLDLPIEETPEYVNNNPAEWADVTTYGATPTNPFFGFSDATVGIQAALNSGKKVVYLGRIGDNGTSYCVYSDIIIPASVRLITGLNLSRFSFFNNSKFIIDSSATKPIIFQGIKGVNILNNSKRTVVFKHGEGMVYNNTARNINGKVFIEDVPMYFRPTFPVRMWARQLNPEVQPENEKDLENSGGRFWILGLKTEGRAIITNTTNGGATEILGALVYPASSFLGTTQPAFTVQDACFSLAGLTMTSYVDNGWYGLGMIETQSDITKTLNSNTIWNTTPYEFRFYKSSVENCCLKMETTKSGSWNDPTVWSCNRIPTIIDDVYINNTHIINVPLPNLTLFANQVFYRGGSVRLSNGTVLKLKEDY